MTETPPPAEQPAEQPTPAEDTAPAPAAAPTRRRWPRRRPADAPPAGADPIPPAVTPPPAPPAAAAAQDPPAEPPTDESGDVPLRGGGGGPRRLRRDRRRLISRREEAVYHLGGLAFELYRRDMLGEEVMRRRAGEVAEIDDTVRDIDARLGEIDRVRRDRRRGEAPDPAAGCCLTCRTPFMAQARFCWQCGAQVVPPSMGDEQVTAIISTRPPA